MPIISVLGDQCSGHDCFPSRNNSSASPNVFAGGKPVHRQSDSWITHCCTHPDVPHGCHSSVLASGSGTVYVNNLQCARIGDPVACGSTDAGPGVSSVIVGG